MTFYPGIDVTCLCIFGRRLDEGDLLRLLHVVKEVLSFEFIAQQSDVLNDELPSLILRGDARCSSLAQIAYVVIPIELRVAMLLEVAEQFQFRLVEHVEAHHYISLCCQLLVDPFLFFLVLKCLNHFAFQHALIHQWFLFTCQQLLLISLIDFGQMIPQGFELALEWGQLCVRRRELGFLLKELSEELFDGFPLLLFQE